MTDIELRKVFALNLRTILYEKKISQKELGERIQKTGEQISRWVNAKTSPGWEHLCLISEALSVSVSELLAVPGRGSKTTIVSQPMLNFENDPEYSRYKRFKEIEKVFSIEKDL